MELNEKWKLTTQISKQNRYPCTTHTVIICYYNQLELSPCPKSSLATALPVFTLMLSYPSSWPGSCPCHPVILSLSSPAPELPQPSRRQHVVVTERNHHSQNHTRYKIWLFPLISHHIFVYIYWDWEKNLTKIQWVLQFKYVFIIYFVLWIVMRTCRVACYDNFFVYSWLTWLEWHWYLRLR